MSLSKQPKSIVIIGSGAIGVEFAYFYNSIGTRVTIVEVMSNIVPLEDIEISKELERGFRNAGIKIMTRSEVSQVDRTGDACKLTIKTSKGTEIVNCDLVLCAIGIVANLEGLGLDNVGVLVEKGKIVVGVDYKTNISGIYAIGDIIDGPALAHLASAEGIICAENIAGKNTEALDYHNVPACIYCQPEIASIGYTEQAAMDAGYKVKTGLFPFSASGKANASGSKSGFVKVIYDAKYGECLGAHMIGSNVTEMIAELVVARKMEITGSEIIKAIHPHPTMSEAVMEATAAAFDEAIHL